MNDSKKRESPEAKIQREVLAARDREAAKTQYKAAQAAEADKTVRLRALRLQREAELAQEIVTKPKRTKTAPKPR